jgi:hypothetical protein
MQLSVISLNHIYLTTWMLITTSCPINSFISSNNTSLRSTKTEWAFLSRRFFILLFLFIYVICSISSPTIFSSFSCFIITALTSGGCFSICRLLKNNLYFLAFIPWCFIPRCCLKKPPKIKQLKFADSPKY